MPSRYQVVAILLFWCASTGWLFYRDLRPLLLPGEPPPFNIDLADEAQTQGNGGEIMWKVLQNGDDKGYAKTSVLYDARADMYDLHGLYKFWAKGRKKGGDADQIIESTYRVTRDGELRAISARVTMDIQGVEVGATIQGPIREQRFLPHIEIESPFGNIKQDLEPLPISTRGSVLNPMQPLNRLPGLRKGQHWRMPLVDPVADVWKAVAAKLNLPGGDFNQGNEIRSLDAKVLRQTQWLEWGRRRVLVPCLVIEYYEHPGDKPSARTWVRVNDGQVFEQEASFHGQNLILVRVDPEEKVEDDPTPKRQQEIRHKDSGRAPRPGHTGR